ARECPPPAGRRAAPGDGLLRRGDDRADEGRPVRPHHRRRAPREPSARDDDDRGRAELQAGLMGEVVALPVSEPAGEERPVLVIDLGGQYSQLIARRVRECRVYSELVGHGVRAEDIRARNPLALVLSGGPASVYADGAPQIDPGIYELGIPTLGICYGMQLMAQDLAGSVDRTGVSEFGKTKVRVHEGALFAGLAEEQTTWMSHRDSVTAPPAGRVGACALRLERRRRFGGRRAARPQGCRGPADMRLRRPWPAAKGRGRTGGRDVSRPLPRSADPRRRRGAVLGPARGRRQPRGKAGTDRRGVHSGLRSRVQETRGSQLSRPGDALLGR